jgi:hypothetical protein
MVRVHTDEWCGSNGLPEMGRSRAAVGHVAGEWARDDDGDGIREVHVNTLEGLWTGLRNFLRPFRGVNKVYLSQYLAMFEWGDNIKRVTEAFVQALWVCGLPPSALHEPRGFRGILPKDRYLGRSAASAPARRSEPKGSW